MVTSFEVKTITRLLLREECGQQSSKSWQGCRKTLTIGLQTGVGSAHAKEENDREGEEEQQQEEIKESSKAARVSSHHCWSVFLVIALPLTHLRLLVILACTGSGLGDIKERLRYCDENESNLSWASWLSAISNFSKGKTLAGDSMILQCKHADQCNTFNTTRAQTYCHRIFRTISSVCSVPAVVSSVPLFIRFLSHTHKKEEILEVWQTLKLFCSLPLGSILHIFWSLLQKGSNYKQVKDVQISN